MNTRVFMAYFHLRPEKSKVLTHFGLLDRAFALALIALIGAGGRLSLRFLHLYQINSISDLI